MAVVFAVSTLLHIDWRLSLVAAPGILMSSTAVAVQTINGRGLLKQTSGSAAFSVLLFQDLAVIPLLLCLALLSANGTTNAIDWMAALRAIGLIIAIVIGGNYALRPVLAIYCQYRDA